MTEYSKIIKKWSRKLFPRFYQSWIRHVYWWWLVGMASDEFSHPQIQLGRHSYGLHKGTVLLANGQERVVIGNYCSIAEGVRMIFGEHSLSAVTTYPLRTRLGDSLENLDARQKGPILIGHDVWIGTNAIILSGVAIGNGAVIGAGAVVTKNVPPYAVVGGVPARVLKLRFEPEQIHHLQMIAWWEWPEEKIRANMELFYGDVEQFIHAHQIIRARQTPD